MPKYLFQGAYIDEGLQGLATEGGTPRVEAARKLFASLGGTLEGFYFAFGPDNVMSAAFSLAINNTGKARGYVPPLLAPEEMDQVITKSPSYRAPGETG